MANIDLTKIYTAKLRKFGMNDGTRFQDAFVSAVNNTFGELNSEVFEAQTLTYLTDYSEVGNDSGLSDRFLQPFNAAVDFHLQESGEYATEAKDDRERLWYGRGMQQARTVYQQQTTYTNPLGV